MAWCSGGAQGQLFYFLYPYEWCITCLFVCLFVYVCRKKYQHDDEDTKEREVNDYSVSSSRFTFHLLLYGTLSVILYSTDVSFNTESWLGPTEIHGLSNERPTFLYSFLYACLSSFFPQRNLVLKIDGVERRKNMGWTIEVRGFDSRQELGIFLFTTASRPVLGPTQPPIQWVPGALPLIVKRPGPEADHSPPSSAEIKEWVELYLHSPQYVLLAWFSVKEQG
jgi:hypothetical protein